MKKQYKEYYKLDKKIRYLELKPLNYLCVSGIGDPNTSPEFKRAIELLYKFSYLIRMSYKKDIKIEGFEIYTVGPLEGIYTTVDNKNYDPKHKENLKFKLMINQPSFVTKQVFEDLKQYLVDISDIDLVKYETITEADCVQILHVGPYDDEPITLKPVYEDLKVRCLKVLPESHHEIYISDPRRSKQENLKTIIRYQVVKDN